MPQLRPSGSSFAAYTAAKVQKVLGVRKYKNNYLLKNYIKYAFGENYIYRFISSPSTPAYNSNRLLTGLD